MFGLFQGTTTGVATFYEERPPLPIPSSAVFSLVDFDSPDSNDLSLNVTVTLSSAVDVQDEGLILEMFSDVTVDSVQSDFTVQYVLSGATNYEEYQGVRIASSGFSMYAVAMVMNYGHFMVVLCMLP